MMTHRSISGLLTVALIIVFQASAVVTLGFSNATCWCSVAKRGSAPCGEVEQGHA
jgi:hypothetical protein